MRARKSITFLIFAFFSSVYFYIGKSYFDLGAYSGNNILFDTDVAWYIDAIGHEPSDWQSLDPDRRAAIWWKHPIMFAYRVLTWPLTYLGLTGPLAAILLASIFSASTSCAVLWAAFLSGLDNAQSLFVAGLFSISSIAVFRGGMPESYAFVSLPVALLWLCLVQATLTRRELPAWGRGLIGAAAIGTTLFFAVLYALIEFLLLIRRKKGLPRYRELLSWDVLAGPVYSVGFFLAALILVYGLSLITVLSDPLSSTRQFLWQAVTHGYTVGLFSLLKAFLVYPLFSPEFTIVNLSIEGDMADFREFLYPAWVLPFISIFILGIIYGAVEGIRDREYRVITIAALAWLTFSIVFHLEYQFRGSVYLYTPHHWFAVFLLIIGAARSLQRRNSAFIRSSVLACFFMLFLSAATINTARTVDLWEWLQTREAPPPKASIAPL